MEPITTAMHKNTGRRSANSVFPYSTRTHKGVSPVVLPLDDEKSRIKVALDKFFFLKAGWDGLEALPVSESAIRNVSQLLIISDNRDWYNWTVEPNINGTVILRHSSRMAGISIGTDAFSYYQKEGNNVTGHDCFFGQRSPCCNALCQFINNDTYQ